MSPESFELLYQAPGVAPYDMGATGSQTLINNGRAVVEAAEEIADQLKELAADHLEAAAGDIILADGAASVAGSPGVSVAITELAATAAEGRLLIGHGSARPVEAPTLVGANCVGDQGMAAWVAPQFSCHAVRVRLDRETGVVRVLQVGAGHDSGTIINPVGAGGQVEGGVMMGIGQALSEGTSYGPDGRQLNPALLDYKLQTAADAPQIDYRFVEVPGVDAGPRGAKGLAEAPNVATAAAIANAVAKLVGRPVRQLPMTPERIWDAIEEAGS
jgi:CO/xanthine dehydrogenase Mo-binding subunit